MSKKMSVFAGLYKIAQTLKFELKPVGPTAENLEKCKTLLYNKTIIREKDVTNEKS